jgi:hypothetical protein
MVDKEALFKPRLPEADVEVPGIGTVRVRGLSRAEALEVSKIVGSGAAMIERKALAMAMLDPKMTEGEIRQWQDAASSGELNAVFEKVNELSGTTEEAAKQAYKEFESDPDSEFRVLPGTATRPHGS